MKPGSLSHIDAWFLERGYTRDEYCEEPSGDILDICYSRWLGELLFTPYVCPDDEKAEHVRVALVYDVAIPSLKQVENLLRARSSFVTPRTDEVLVNFARSARNLPAACSFAQRGQYFWVEKHTLGQRWQELLNHIERGPPLAWSAITDA